MRFRCGKCSTVYSLPDERVAGKILKIRCRRCSEINTVDGSAIDLSAPSTAALQRPSPPQPPRLATPSAAAAALDTTPPRPIAGIAHARTPEPAAPAPAPTPASPPPEAAAMQPAVASPAQAEQSSPGAPPEDTRLAIAQAGMARRAAKHRLYATLAIIGAAALTAAVLLDAFGVIQIPGVHFAVDAARQVVVKSAPDTAPPPWTSVLSEEERAAMRRALLAGDTAEIERVRRKARARAAKLGWEIDLGDHTTSLEVSAEDLRRRGEASAASVALAPEQQLALKGLAQREDKRQATIMVKPSLPEIKLPSRTEGGLEAKQIAEVVAANHGGINYCATQETKRGLELPPKLNLAITVIGYGKVTAVEVIEAEHRATTLGRCLVSKVRIWRFPAFTGAPMDVEIPLKFTTVQ